jgi:prepilin-type processing-associated H-X9-DG protein
VTGDSHDWLANRHKYSEILIPGPSEVFVFIEENEKSINDGEFIINHADPHDSLMKDGSNGQPTNENEWFSLPTDRHNQAASLSFADGSARTHPWKVPKRFQSYGQPTDGGDRQDLRSLQSVIPRLR